MASKKAAAQDRPEAEQAEARPVVAWGATGTALEDDPMEAISDLIVLPSPDFWREETPRLQGTRYLSFDLAGTAYALPLAHVREVDRLPQVTPVPNVPAWVLGAANLRGEILSVVDLAAFLGLVSARPPRDARLLACRAGSMEVGLVVERLRDIRELPDAAIRPPAGPIPARAARYLAGVHAGDGRLTLILDVPRLLQSPELRTFA